MAPALAVVVVVVVKWYRLYTRKATRLSATERRLPCGDGSGGRVLPSSALLAHRRRQASSSSLPCRDYSVDKLTDAVFHESPSFFSSFHVPPPHKLTIIYTTVSVQFAAGSHCTDQFRRMTYRPIGVLVDLPTPNDWRRVGP